MLLSAKLAEGKIRIVDSEALEEAKTKILNKIMEKYGNNARIVLVPSYVANKNFSFAAQNLQNVQISLPNVHFLFNFF